METSVNGFCVNKRKLFRVDCYLHTNRNPSIYRSPVTPVSPVTHTYTHTHTHTHTHRAELWH